ncbi:MAG: IS200/IS605 family transposase [Calditrichaceae bacterium]|nr:IS200/IS605 family transposase [Calditrichaceae bacterium]MBN2710239.1 IS200/IS605 family transposase [Calditrichaceae bacterium]RQV93863.1 MAG: IS200/IS605 family transposase [Calditrichota bacterium]
MANTYTQLYVQIIFAVKDRANHITEQHREELEKYICGIINNKKSKPLAIFCNPDHTHVLIGLHPSFSVSDIARDIKANSSRFINEKKWIRGKFNWQDGFGAFSYAKSQLNNVVKYVLNQPFHHKKKSFREEYMEFLKKFEIDFDPQYLFEWIE